MAVNVTATGDVTVQSQNNVDAKTVTDGTSVESTSLGIGVGASFNLPIADNQAFIDNSTISANNVTVDASMQDKSGDVIHIRSHRKPARVPEVRSSWEQVRLPGTVRIIRPMRVPSEARPPFRQPVTLLSRRLTSPRAWPMRVLESLVPDDGLGIAFALNQPMNSTLAEIVDQADVTTATNISVLADGHARFGCQGDWRHRGE